MPTETKKSTAKASRRGSASAAAWWLTGDWATIMPGEEGPQGHGRPEQGGPGGHRDRDHHHGQGEQLARAEPGHLRQDGQGTTREPATKTRATSRASFPRARASVQAEGRTGACPPAEDGDQHQDDHRQHVLDDQPPHGDVPGGRAARAASIGPHQHDGAGHGHGDADHGPRPLVQPNHEHEADAEHGRRQHCPRAPGIATALTASRSSRWKWRPTPNISRITPTSASWLARCRSPWKPGVCGPDHTRPAGSRRSETARSAASPPPGRRPWSTRRRWW